MQQLDWMPIFQSTPSVWRETETRSHVIESYQFQSTPSVWRETSSPPQARLVPPHFNPLPPCGGRHFCGILYISHKNFNPLPPCGGRHSAFTFSNFAHDFNPLPPCGGRLRAISPNGGFGAFQSTPSVWRETYWTGSKKDGTRISIHSLRVEGDLDSRSDRVLIAISIHSLRVEGDEIMPLIPVCDSTFQSTPSVWRETQRR